ncbi:MAG: hypothetical protein PWR07_1775 [Bacillota bacterium]|nr:hypothetical protein [Bacillota bacterium]
MFLSASEDLRIVASRSHGAVYAVLGMIRELGLDQLIYSRDSGWRRLVLAMVVVRILKGGSELFASRWWRGTMLPEELSLPTEGKVVNHLYEAMDELLSRQGAIQKKLARRHLQEGYLVLWDLTSSYQEGRTCSLAALGKNRDGKKGKRQFTHGILTDMEGRPIAVEVFRGNMSDPLTVRPQREAAEGVRVRADLNTG